MRQYPDAPNVIRTEMVRCGYTLERLSQETEISVPVLRGIIAGRSDTISIRNIVALSQAFGYSSADFIDLLCGNLSRVPEY